MNRLTRIALVLMSATMLLFAACGGDVGGVAVEPSGVTGATASTEVDGPPLTLPQATAAPSSSSTAVEVVETPTGPTCDVVCTVVLDGDSLTFGLNGLFCGQLGVATCVNSGVPGHRSDQIRESALVEVDPLLAGSPNATSVVIVWAGTNDLWQQHHSSDPAENAVRVYEILTGYVDDRRAAGWDYVLVASLARMNPELITGADQLDELIRQNSAGADAIVDLSAEPRLADPFDPVLRQSDGIHFNDPGRQIVVGDHLVPSVRALGRG